MPEDGRIKMFAKDIVRKPEKAIDENMKFSDILRLFHETNAASIPVLDHNDRFLGDITIEDVLRKGLPDPAEYFEDLDFMLNPEDFFKNLNKNSQITASDINTDSTIKIEKKTSIMEVGFLIEKYKKDLYVLEGDKLIGIISPKELLNEYIKWEEKCF